MASLPDTLERKEHVDLHGRGREQWVRRGILLALVGLAVAGLVGVFGQRGTESTAAGATASLTVEAPTELRSGLMFQARFEIDARAPIENPILVLDHGWFDGMTINSIEPAPVAELERGGQMIFVYDGLDAGDQLVVCMEPQVNPTTIGSRSQGVALNDGGEVLVRIERSATIFP